MSYRVVRASNQSINTASAFSGTGVQTAHLRVKLSALPSGTGYPNRMRLIASNEVSGYCPILLARSTGFAFGFYNGSYRETTRTYTLNTTDWMSICVVWDFSTTTASIKLYVNGAIRGSAYTVTRGTVSLQTDTRLGGDPLNLENSSADLADYGFWNAELTQGEISELAAAFPVRGVRPSALLRDVPMIRELQDLRSGTAVTTTNGPTVSDHPRAIFL